jgi:hypothetical protein
VAQVGAAASPRAFLDRQAGGKPSRVFLEQLDAEELSRL